MQTKVNTLDTGAPDHRQLMTLRLALDLDTEAADHLNAILIRRARELEGDDGEVAMPIASPALSQAIFDLVMVAGDADFTVPTPAWRQEREAMVKARLAKLAADTATWKETGEWPR